MSGGRIFRPLYIFRLSLLLLIGKKGLTRGFSSFSSSSPCRTRHHHRGVLFTPINKQRLFCSSTTKRDVTVLRSSTTFSNAAEWHRDRRKQMMAKYGDQIRPLERSSSSQSIALPLLILTNASLLILSILCGRYLDLPTTIFLGLFPGSILSLWQLQILHDCLHGSLFAKQSKRILFWNKNKLQNWVLFWGSMPSVFGYYLYLKFGHLTHHTNVGDPDKASLAKLFSSSQVDFEDGDVLFVAHRMRLLGDIGPTFQLPTWKTKKKKEITMSISNSAFQSWNRNGNFIFNTIVFASSFLFERFMLLINDAVVSLTRHNAFFPNKPKSFHIQCAHYAQCATILRLLLVWTSGWKSLLFLYLAETLWSIPPHPASAMFVTNHPSSMDHNSNECTPSMSTYVGKWYSLLTLGTNYHCEHHDFPTIPLHKLGQLRKIAPEYYRSGSNDNIYQIMKQTFAKPDFYACMNVNNQS